MNTNLNLFNPGAHRSSKDERRQVDLFNQTSAAMVREGELVRLAAIIDAKITQGHIQDVADMYHIVRAEIGNDPVLEAILLPMLAGYQRAKIRKITGAF